MSITGEGKIQRKMVMHFVNVGTTDKPEWERIGKGIEELTREMNNNVKSTTDITGETDVEVTLGNQTTAVEPFKARRESKLFQKLYKIYTDDLELSDVEMDFLEVSVFDEISDGVYAAIKQRGAVDLKSFGGPTTGVEMPFDVNYIGAKEKGNFTLDTLTYAKSTGV